MTTPADNTARVLRYDRGELLRSHRTAEGYLLAEGYAARTGILVYQRADGTEVRELVTPEELFSPASLGTLGRKPVTLGHPREDVGPANIKQLGVGDVDSEIAEEQGGFVRVKVAIRREDAIAAAESEDAAELSCGYTAVVTTEPGVWRGQPYDAVQSDRQYNHLALVPRGRAGAEVRLRLDSGAAVMVAPTKKPKEEGLPPTQDPPQEGGTMASVTIDGVTYGILDSGLAQAVSTQGAALVQARADMAAKGVASEGAQKEYDALKGKFDAGQTELDKMKKQMDELKLKMAKEAKKNKGDALDPAAFLLRFDERVKLLSLAKSKGVEKHDELDDAALRLAVIKADAPDKKLDGLSDEYIQAYVDGVADRQDRADADHDDAARRIAGHADGSSDPKGKPRKYADEMKAAFDEQDRQLSGATDDNGGK